MIQQEIITSHSWFQPQKLEGVFFFCPLYISNLIQMFNFQNNAREPIRDTSMSL